MTDSLRVILEIGKKKRVVAGAMDWPGLDRWGTSEDGAIEKMVSYRPRYAGVAERAGMAKAFATGRRPGGGGTRTRGRVDGLLGHRPRSRPRSSARCCRLRTSNGGSTSSKPAGRTSTTWRAASPLNSALDRVAEGGAATGSSGTSIGSSPGSSRTKSRSGRPIEVSFAPDELAAHREAFLAAIRAYNAEGKPARTWPIQFLIRRVAHHVMDHAWEMEDRDLTPS